MADLRVGPVPGTVAREVFEENVTALLEIINARGMGEFKERFGSLVPDARQEAETRAHALEVLNWVTNEVDVNVAADNTGHGDDLLPGYCLKICDELKGILAPSLKAGSRKRQTLSQAERDELKLGRGLLRFLMRNLPRLDGAYALLLHRSAALVRERRPLLGAAMRA